MPPRYPCRHRSGSPETLPEEELGQSRRADRGFTRERAHLRALTPADTTRPTLTSIRRRALHLHGQRTCMGLRRVTHRVAWVTHAGRRASPKSRHAHDASTFPTRPLPAIRHGRLKLSAPQTAMATQHAAQRQPWVGLMREFFNTMAAGALLVLLLLACCLL
jgi:hypothetical protein